MKLSRKQEPSYKKEEPVYKKAPPVDWSKYCIDWDKPVPHGKYEGSTLEWIRDSDDWYFNWMKEQNVWADWNLLILRSAPVKKKYTNFISSKGEQWVDLRIVDEPCSAWDKIEDYIINTSS